MRCVLTTLALALGLVSTTAHADVVDVCPPGFRSSHSGCHFAPGPEDLVFCGGCASVILGLGAVSALLVWRKRGASSPREGDHGERRGRDGAG